MIQRLSCSKVWFTSIMQKLKLISQRSFPLILWLKMKTIDIILKGLFQTLNIFMIANNGMMFELLFLIQLLLVVVSIPKIIIVANMR